MPPKVSIIILNWNGYDDTKECLGSVGQIDYPDYDVIVVDNGSKDGSVEKLEKGFPSVFFIKNPVNLGFTGGNNVGMREALKADPDYILLLNNDTTVDRSMLSELVKAAESDENIGIAGPKIYFYSDPQVIWSAGTRRDIFMRSKHIGYGEKDAGQYSEVKDVAEVTGCAMLIRRRVIEKIGMLNEDYFRTGEDTEFCLRARRAGFRIVFAPGSRMWHKVSMSTGGENSPSNVYYSRRNALYLAQKYFPSLLFFVIAKFIVRYFAYAVRSDRKRARAVRSALLDFFSGKKGRSGEY
jgi:GT2 family glycosyltransferase